VITTSFGYQLKLKERLYDIDIDVFINKIVDPFNSLLIQTYARLDSRFLKLALILKYWNKKTFDKMGSNKLNSYSIVLMLIAFLQKEDVLPSL
jgi:DNA polymerase sigma